MQLSFLNPIQDLATGYLIKVIHHRLIIEADFEMTQEVRLEYFTDDDGQFGIPVAESLRLNPNLSEDQKARLIQAFRPVTRSASTRGVMIDPVTHEQVFPADSGDYPEGAIPEKLLWLNVLASQVPGDKLSDKVKAMLLDSMGKMVARGRI